MLDGMYDKTECGTLCGLVWEERDLFLMVSLSLSAFKLLPIKCNAVLGVISFALRCMFSIYFTQK